MTRRGMSYQHSRCRSTFTGDVRAPLPATRLISLFRNLPASYPMGYETPKTVCSSNEHQVTCRVSGPVSNP